MTNLEYAKAVMGVNYPLDDDFFTAALLGQGIVSDDDFVAGKKYDLAFAYSLIYLLGSAESISEGGYTVKLNMDAITNLIGMLFRKWGVPNPLSKTAVVDITNQW